MVRVMMEREDGLLWRRCAARFGDVRNVRIESALFGWRRMEAMVRRM